MQVDVDASAGDERMKIVGLRLSKHVVERGQLHSWPLFDEREDRLSRPLVRPLAA